MTEITEYGTREVDTLTPDEVWLIAYTIRSVHTDVRFRKLYFTAFLSERAAQEFQAEFGDFYTKAGFVIETVDYLKFAEVPF